MNARAVDPSAPADERAPVGSRHALAMRGAVLIGQRSRKRIKPFRLHRPRDLDDAVRAWREANGSGALLAGGVDLINEMKEGARFSDVVDLSGVARLKRIEVQGDALTLGAMVTHEQFAAADLPAALQPFAREWRVIANPRVRHKGTLGGNIMAANPAYDLAPCLIALGARLVGRNRQGESVVLSPAATADILLTAIAIPLDLIAFAFDRSQKPELSLSIAARGSGAAIERLDIGVATATDAVVHRSIAMTPRTSLDDVRRSAARVAEQFEASLEPVGDGSPALSRYGARLAGVLIRRILTDLGQDVRS